MKTIKLLILLSLLTSLSFAQKFSYDKSSGVITVKGKPYAKLKRTSAEIMPLNKNFLFTDLNGNELIYMKLKKIKRLNPTGRLIEEKTGYEIFFLETETDNTAFLGYVFGTNRAIKLVLRNNLIEDGTINPEAKDDFLIKYHDVVLDN